MTFPADLKAEFIKKLNSNNIPYHNSWSNYMRTVTNPAAIVVEIETRQQLQTVMKKISKLNSNRNPENKITVRATAGWSDPTLKACCFFPWNNVQENAYNEGYSFSQVVGGKAESNGPGTDVIIRFSKKFHHMKVLGAFPNPTRLNPQNPIHQLASYLVEVSAGVQISELADFLRHYKNKDNKINGLSLPTVSIIPWVTAVGLAGTAGHGTGRDEPAFSGLIESIKVCDMDGAIRTIARHDPNFDALVGGHSGLLGVVVSMKIRAVQAFNLVETITLFPSAKDMAGKLNDILKNNQYVSFMGVPTYKCRETDKLVDKWQIREWNHSTLSPTKKDEATYSPNTTSFIQELEVKIGSSVMNVLIEPEFKHLLPLFMLLSAASITGSRGTKPIVDFENNITHPFVSFPKFMHDVSYLIPVKDKQAGSMLETLLKGIEDLLNASGKKGDYPITYAIYVRYLKGTNSGLSTSQTSSDDERILAIDMVTHPNAPGRVLFEQKFLAFLKDMGITPRNHLGKDFPSGVVRYDQFLGKNAVLDYKKALESWCNQLHLNNGEARLAMSPFYTPYYQSMFSPTLEIKNQRQPNKHTKASLNQSPQITRSKEEQIKFLSVLHAAANQTPVYNEEGKAAKIKFLHYCQAELESREFKSQKNLIV